MNFFARIFRLKPKKDDTEQPEKIEQPEPSPRDIPGANRSLDMDQRVRRAVESILENETLTQDLEDEAASVLLEWGTSWAEQVVRTALPLDVDSAPEAIESRLRTLRQMVRLISRWVGGQAAMEEGERIENLRKIVDLANLVRSGQPSNKDESLLATWAQQLVAISDQPKQVVIMLRAHLEETILPGT